jgi:peptide/nickel transport system ATP-binding protein
VLRLLPKSAEVTGKVLLDGEDVYAMTPGRLRAVRWTSAAVVFQGALHSLNPVRRVGDQIVEAIHLHSRDTEGTARKRTGELLERVGIPASRGRSYPHQLSGGQRQRVLIALALACEPKLLIADEPTTALDVTIQAQILALLKDLRAELGMAVLLITHDLGVVAHFAENVHVMYAGKIVERASTRDLFAAAAHPYTRALLAALPKPGNEGARLEAIPGRVPHPSRLPVGCAFSPRCKFVMDRCPTDQPPLLHASPDHVAACWLLEEKAK